MGQKVWDGTADTGWYNKEETEFDIRNAEQLAGLAQLVNGGESMRGKSIYLRANIALNGKNSHQQWVPIGTFENPFTGTFNGQGRTISGLRIDSANDYQGLFGYVHGGVITFFKVNDFCVEGRQYVGCLAGSIKYGTIKGISFGKNTVRGLVDVGDFAGRSVHSNILDNDCYVATEAAAETEEETEWKPKVFASSEGDYLGELKTAEQCLAAVKQRGQSLRFVPEEFKTAELCKAAVQDYASARRACFEVDDDCRFDPDLPNPIEYVPEKLKTAEFYLAMVQEFGLLLCDVPKEFQTAELCLAAIQQDGLALQFVPEKFKSEELCLAAVLRRSGAWFFGHDGLAEQLQYVPEAFLEKFTMLLIEIEKYSQEAQAAWEKDDYGKELECWEKTAKLYGKHIIYVQYLCIRLAELYGDKGNYDKAIEWHKKVIELYPDAYNYNNIGWYYAKKQDYGKAIEYCKKAIELDPDYAEAHHSLGFAYAGKKNYGKATECYEKVIELDPNLAEMHRDDIAVAKMKNYSANTDWHAKDPAADIFTVSTAEELAGLAQLVNDGESMEGKIIKLEADIALNDTADWKKWGDEYHGERLWTAIGTEENPFQGTFDGNGYVVSGICIDEDEDGEYQGLFGYAGKSSLIKNLGVKESSISSYAWYVGGLAGYSKGAIASCYAKCNVTGSCFVGGLAGWCRNISNCYAKCDVMGYGDTGGLAGMLSDGTIANCYAAGTIYKIQDDDPSEFGGLLGDNFIDSEGTIASSYYNSETSGQSDTGKGEGKTTAEMRNRDAYIGWDFEKIWDMASSINGGMPYLRWQKREFCKGQICACCNDKPVDPEYWLDKTLGYCTDCADVLCLGDSKKTAFSEAQMERMKKSLENI